MSDRGSPSPRRSRSISPRVPDENKRSPFADADAQQEQAAEDNETLRRSRSPARADGKDVSNPGNNLYVANLATRMGQSELQEIFSKFGRVEKCEVIVDPVTRESRGFAFVTFEDVRDAEDAVKELNKCVVYGVKKCRDAGLEWNMLNGSVDMKKHLGSILGQNLLAPNTEDVIAPTGTVAEDGGVAAEIAVDSPVGLTTETGLATMTGTEDVAAMTTAIETVAVTTATHTMTDAVVRSETAPRPLALHFAHMLKFKPKRESRRQIRL
ncbi:hypothetical protein PsorP6_004652 [Peronosclerospora sorghi]|uniref:Uncharacterized protein n=1 Tax=Peronosclerospora sorghi TaxID=230839 RepID=A0ACC0VK25_9STRA|nr:hypothetical protein PsorP6_004652 [Peronosclerospora sorghi]